MKLGALAVTLTVVFCMTSLAHTELNRLVLDGQVAAASGTRKASLHLLCNPDTDGGAISVELWVPQAFTLRDFDYDDFEGPDAAARNRALSKVSVIGEGGKADVTHAAGGWYSGDDPDTFVFGLSQRSHQTGKIATWLKAIDATHTQLVWVQTAFDKSKRQLRATFVLDPATVKRIRDAIDACIVPPVTPHARSKK